MPSGDVGDAGASTQATVTVRGDALIRAEPDEALLLVTLSALEEGPGRALADVSTRSKALVAMLDEVGVAKADRSTTGIAIREEFDHTSEGRRSLGHRASSTMAVRLSDPERMGILIARTSDELAAQLDGPRWQIAADNPVRLEAARMAAAEATRKARAYAEGAGAELGPLLRLSEPESPSPVRARGLQPLSASGAMPIEAGENELVASIQATFELKVRRSRRGGKSGVPSPGYGQ